MDALPSLLAQIGDRLARDPGARAQAFARLADLVVQGEGLGTEQMTLLDQVLTQVAPLATLPSRAAVAERLGPLGHAPRGILRLLALDDAIVVARPVLTQAARLDDQDLMTVATGRGPDHRLAICLRGTISEIVTDTLVATGERTIEHALARNPGARLSPLGAATLIDRSRDDDALQDLMGARPDLPAQLSATLLTVVRESVRDRLLGLRPAATVDAAPAKEPGETELAAFAAARQSAEVELLFATLTGLSRAVSNRLLTEPDSDLLLIVGRARGWSWTTMRRLLALRDPGLVQRHQFRTFEATFEAVTSATAERVLRFLAQPGSRVQARLKVR